MKFAILNCVIQWQKLHSQYGIVITTSFSSYLTLINNQFYKLSPSALANPKTFLSSQMQLLSLPAWRSLGTRHAESSLTFENSLLMYIHLSETLAYYLW